MGQIKQERDGKLIFGVEKHCSGNGTVTIRFSFLCPGGGVVHYLHSFLFPSPWSESPPTSHVCAFRDNARQIEAKNERARNECKTMKAERSARQQCSNLFNLGLLLLRVLCKKYASLVETKQTLRRVFRCSLRFSPCSILHYRIPHLRGGSDN